MRWRESATCSRRPKPPRRNSRSWLSRLLGGRLMRVCGRSMEPTLQPSALVFVSERIYEACLPERGDIVAAHVAALGGRTLVKRLVGLPHEQVEYAGRRWQLGAEQFFLLSDRSECGIDSRTFGPITRQELLGPVRRWPWPYPVDHFLRPILTFARTVR